MNRPLIVAIFLISVAPVDVRGQQPNVAKLKADAQKVVSIIKSDKAKTELYCEINNLGEQIGEADQEERLSERSGTITTSHRVREKAWSRILCAGE